MFNLSTLRCVAASFTVTRPILPAVGVLMLDRNNMRGSRACVRALNHRKLVDQFFVRNSGVSAIAMYGLPGLSAIEDLRLQPRAHTAKRHHLPGLASATRLSHTTLHLARAFLSRDCFLDRAPQRTLSFVSQRVDQLRAHTIQSAASMHQNEALRGSCSVCCGLTNIIILNE